jgi:hypothetical protein
MIWFADLKNIIYVKSSRILEEMECLFRQVADPVSFLRMGALSENPMLSDGLGRLIMMRLHRGKRLLAIWSPTSTTSVKEVGSKNITHLLFYTTQTLRISKHWNNTQLIERIVSTILWGLHIHAILTKGALITDLTSPNKATATDLV